MAHLLLPGSCEPALVIWEGAFPMEESRRAQKSYGRSDILDRVLSAFMFPSAAEVASRLSTAYEAHGQFLRAVAVRKFRIPSDDVPELVQDVFLSFLRHHERVRDDRAWLLGAICNASKEYWSRKGETREFDVQRADQIASDGRDLADAVDVAAVLAQLSPRCAEVLRLRFLEGWSTEEVAQRLSTTPNNTKQIVHRCKASARALFVCRQMRN